MTQSLSSLRRRPTRRLDRLSARGARRRLRFEFLERRAMLTTLSGDFNNDGFDDLAIGMPLETVNGLSSAGQVLILYGSASSVNATSSEVWSQDSPSVNGVAEQGENFGSALAVGDFNNDGF